MTFGIALVTALAALVGSGSADAADSMAGDASSGAPGAVELQLIPGSRYPCTVSSTVSPTGRDEAELVVLRDGFHCSRRRTGNIAPAYVASCHQVARNIGCVVID